MRDAPPEDMAAMTGLVIVAVEVDAGLRMLRLEEEEEEAAEGEPRSLEN